MDYANKGRYTFRVAIQANKKDIKKAVESLFKVNVVQVATMIGKGGSLRTGARRVPVEKASWKKAIVRVKAGQKIAVFEVGA